MNTLRIDLVIRATVQTEENYSLDDIAASLTHTLESSVEEIEVVESTMIKAKPVPKGER